MSHMAHTPESLLPRSDSKNPATTCRGLTSNGRPCRRGLARRPRSSPFPFSTADSGAITISQTAEAQNLTVFYCWQHKEQSEQRENVESRTRLLPLRQRSSIDTLVGRVGVIHLDDNVATAGSGEHRRTIRRISLEQRDTLRTGRHNIQSPVTTVPAALLEPKHYQPPSMGRSNTKASFLCCIRSDDDDLPPARRRPHQHRPASPEHASSRKSGSQVQTSTASGLPSMASVVSAFPSNRPSSRPPAHRHSSRHSNPDPQSVLNLQPASQDSASVRLALKSGGTQTLLSLIPAGHSPTTTSQLLAELCKPISSADEAGYIYIFWLTPESEASKPDDETASSLLTNDEPVEWGRRQDVAVQRYASLRRTSTAQTRRTILLKIGRAANVHRRLSQWTKQCGQNITLVRYYPYIPSRPVSTSQTPPRKVPHVHRVERLIHVELADMRAHRGECDACGREHQEWFEIEASRKALRVVDQCVKRWVSWAESTALSDSL